RRKVYVSLSTPIPEKLLQLDSENRSVQATNDYNKLQVYLYFSVPVLNSSTEIMNSLNISQGSLLPTSGESLGNRRFGFMIANISSTAIISVDFNSESIITRQGTQVSPIAPVTFLYDSRRPAVMLSTYSMRTREDNLSILINFMKPVFGFNASCISILGGSLKSFNRKRRSTYVVEIQANEDLVFVSVPENVTSDVVGNQNLASKVLQVRHYSVPVISSVVYAFTTASFVVTLIAAGLLTIATSSLQSVVPSMRPSIADPARNLFRIMGHIQVFALSRWLAVELPVEFFEFARHLQWTIPYFSVPWEAGHMNPFMVGSSPFGSSNSFTKASATITNTLFKSLSFTSSVNGSPTLKKNKGHGSPLNSSEYKQYCEGAEYISDSQHSSGWTDFYRSMFWLAVICGGLMVLHAFLLIILKFGKRNSENRRTYGALTFPRFEIFILSLALPSICRASAVLIRGNLNVIRGAPSAVAVGILLLVFVFIMLLALFLFLLVGITFGRLLQYKEGQWTWKEQTKSVYLTIFGPLFEDLRGPQKYMLSQISGGNLPTQRGSITASGDETKDAKAPFIQKLFGNLRIYYVLLEYIRRVSLGILAGFYNQTQTSKSPVIIMLSISSFELFFIVLKKPFINKKVQLVEIISLTCEVALFATCLVLLKKEGLSVRSESKFGIFMLVLFLLGYCPQITNEWNALYVQTRLLDPEEKSLLTGSKIASIGFLRYFIPQKYIKNLEESLPQNGNEKEETRDTSLGTDEHRRSAPTDPSTSGTTRQSGPEQKNATKRKRKEEVQAHAPRENNNQGIEDNKEKELVTGNAMCQETSGENEWDDSGTREATNDDVTGDDSGTGEAANDNVTGDAMWQATSEENEWDDSGIGEVANDNDGDGCSGSRSSGTPAKASFGRGRGSAPTDHSTSGTTRRSGPGQKNVTKRKNKGEAQAHTQKRENNNLGIEDDKEKELVTGDAMCQATSGENEWDDNGTGEVANDNVIGDATWQATSGENEWDDSGTGEAANDNVTWDATWQATIEENKLDDSGTGEVANDNVTGDDSGTGEATNDNVTGDATWQATSEENKLDDSGMGEATNDNDGDRRSSSKSPGTPTKASFGRGRSSAPTDHSTSGTTRRSGPGQKNKRENNNKGIKDDKEKELVTEDAMYQATSGENEDDSGTGEVENDNVTGDATGQATSGENEWGDSGMEEAANDNDKSTT
ncbi:uncharacterized protein LOC133301403, partial [Gastrolobium bilobum]|uniref:uncharacterized protein LOC133301403 n=1 Tax=Gastrolobium bilobum TaxID=150636 RepID=UPI002AB07520